MPLHLTILKSNQSIIDGFLSSISIKVLKDMIKRKEHENIEKGYQDRSNYMALNMDNASKSKLIAYYMLIKKRRITSERVRNMIEVI